MLVRQVQAHEIQGPDLREVRRRGHAGQGAPRAHGPYPAGGAGRPHLVSEVAAVPHRPAARYDAQGPRARTLLRELHRDRAGHDHARGEAAPDGGAVQPGGRAVRPGCLYRRHRRRGDPRAAHRHGSAQDSRSAAPGDRRGDHRAQAQEARQAPQGHRGLHRVRQPAGVDDPHRGSGHSAGVASARPARWRPFRHVGPERSLSPRHQPQQPPEAADGAARARHHHPQREADAAGVGRRAIRQRQAWPRHHGCQQAPAEIARRHAEGQAGPVPPEPARQARGLLGPLGDRGRSRTQAAPVRLAQEDGARAVQAVHLRAAAGHGPGGHRQAGQETRREGEGRGLGRARRGHSRAPRAAQSCADAASPGHPGVRADAHRGQGHSAASAGLRGLQRRLRRRPDGRARAACRWKPSSRPAC